MRILYLGPSGKIPFLICLKISMCLQSALVLLMDAYNFLKNCAKFKIPNETTTEGVVAAPIYKDDRPGQYLQSVERNYHSQVDELGVIKSLLGVLQASL